MHFQAVTRLQFWSLSLIGSRARRARPHTPEIVSPARSFPVDRNLDNKGCALHQARYEKTCHRYLTACLLRRTNALKPRKSWIYWKKYRSCLYDIARSFGAWTNIYKDTDLNRAQLSLCVSLIENGVNPEALAVSLSL